MLLAGQNSRRVDDRHAFEHLIIQCGTLEAVQERIAEPGTKQIVIVFTSVIVYAVILDMNKENRAERSKKQASS